jgi:hypothetical protein
MKPANRLWRATLVRGFVAGLVFIGAPIAGFAQASASGVEIERLTLTSPWLNDPHSRTQREEIDRADVIWLATGHRDEIGEALEIAEGTLKGKIPDKQLVRTPVGAVRDVEGLWIRVGSALHGSGVRRRNYAYGGAAVGFLSPFENGFTPCFTDSTDITVDMQLWGARAPSGGGGDDPTARR